MLFIRFNFNNEIFMPNESKRDRSGPPSVTNPPKTVEIAGNADAKILAVAFEEYSKDGLTKAEREKIENLGAILKDAAIVISPDGNTAAIAENDGKTFTLTAKPGGRSK
jgi:hypothetical protein